MVAGERYRFSPTEPTISYPILRTGSHGLHSSVLISSIPMLAFVRIKPAEFGERREATRLRERITVANKVFRPTFAVAFKLGCYR